MWDIQTWSSRDLSLGLETSRDPFLQVLVSVLVLGLATIQTRFSSLMKREIVRLPPLLLWNGWPQWFADAGKQG